MSEARKLMAEVLRAAIRGQTWTYDGGDNYLVVDGDLDVEDLAAEVDKALGELTLIYRPGTFPHQTAWVSGWTEAPHG